MAIFTGTILFNAHIILGDMIYSAFLYEETDQQGWGLNQGYSDISSQAETDSRSAQWLFTSELERI